MAIIESIKIKDIDMSKCYFNAGCAINVYKPQIAQKMFLLLKEHFGPVKHHNICCHHNPNLPQGSTIINNCAGCDRRFRTLYEGINTITFWEVLDTLSTVKLPDWSGLSVSVHDSCSFRQKPQVHNAVRNILKKMNIKIIENDFCREKSVCCGDTFYGVIPNAKVIEAQKRRAAQMPCDKVLVYCIGCLRALYEGGKQTLYLPDLIFGAISTPIKDDLQLHHRLIEKYRAEH